MQPRECWAYVGAGGVVVEKKDVCRGLFVNVALLDDPSEKPRVTPHPRHG